MGQTLKKFRTFCYEYRWTLLGIIAITLTAYWYSMMNFTLSIDEEVSWSLIHSFQRIFELNVGSAELGSAALNWIAGTASSVPFWNAFASAGALAFFCVLMGFSFWLDGDKSKSQLLVISGVFITCTTHFYLMDFSPHSFIVYLGYCWIALAVLLLRSWVRNNEFSWIKFLAAVLLTLLAISTYLSLAGCFLIVCCIFSLHYANNKKLSLWAGLGILLKYILVLGASCILFVLLTMLVQLFIPSSEFFMNAYFLWGVDGSNSSSVGLGAFVVSTLFGDTTLGGVFITIPLVLLVFSMLYRAIRNERHKRFDALHLLALIMIVSPFALNILVGGPLNPSSMQGIALLSCGAWCFVFISIPQEKAEGVLKYSAVVACSFIIVFQVLAINQLAQLSVQRFEGDEALAYRIEDRVEQLTGEKIGDEPIVFLGGQFTEENLYLVSPYGKSIRTEGIARSFFGWDPAFGQSRLYNFFRYLGSAYPYPTSEEVSTAQQLGIEMPCWPETESVAQKEGVIIVKLSNDSDPLAFEALNLDPDSVVPPAALSEWKGARKTIDTCYLDAIEVLEGENGKVLEMRGWAVIEEEGVYQKSSEIALQIGDSYYYAAQIDRPDVVKAIGNGIPLEVGFHARIPVSAIPEMWADPEYPGHYFGYTIKLIGITSDNKVYECSTQPYIEKINGSLNISLRASSSSRFWSGQE